MTEEKIMLMKIKKYVRKIAILSNITMRQKLRYVLAK